MTSPDRLEAQFERERNELAEAIHKKVNSPCERRTVPFLVGDAERAVAAVIEQHWVPEAVLADRHNQLAAQSANLEFYEHWIESIRDTLPTEVDGDPAELTSAIAMLVWLHAEAVWQRGRAHEDLKKAHNVVGTLALAARDLLVRLLAPLPEWQCPACGATTRARLADKIPAATHPCPQSDTPSVGVSHNSWITDTRHDGTHSPSRCMVCSADLTPTTTEE